LFFVIVFSSAEFLIFTVFIFLSIVKSKIFSPVSGGFGAGTNFLTTVITTSLF